MTHTQTQTSTQTLTPSLPRQRAFTRTVSGTNRDMLMHSPKPTPTPKPTPKQSLPQGTVRAACALALAGMLGACSEPSKLPVNAMVGPQPQLVEPARALLPTVHIAPAVGWAPGQRPAAAPGLQVSAFGVGLSHPRWLTVLPNGDVLVAESNAPPRPRQGQGPRGWVMKKVMAKAGAGVPSANRITLLRDADGDGKPELITTLLENLHSPFGMVLVGDKLYVANTDAVIEYAYIAGATRIDSPGRQLTDLPGGDLNHHWTKNLIASPDGSKLYATVGSNSNVAENGIEEEQGRAAIWEIDRASGTKRLFATGLRNPNGMAWTADGVLWTVVNERDELGNDLVPDYLTSVRDGGFYGWPWSYYGNQVDKRVEPPRPERVARALIPDYALGAHVAPLGLVAAGRGALANALHNASEARASAAAGSASKPPLPAPTVSAASASKPMEAGASSPNPALATAAVQGMFVGLHGSWNRRPRSGYKVIYVPFSAGKPVGEPIDVLGGFVNAAGEAMGRPVGVAIDTRGGLLVADDVGNVVWRVTAR